MPCFGPSSSYEVCYKIGLIWYFEKADYGYLDAAYNAAFAKIFNSFDKSVIRNCQFYCGVLPLSLRIDIRRLQFYVKLSATRSDSLRGLYLLSGKHEFDGLLSKHDLFTSYRPNLAGWQNSIWQNFQNLIEEDNMA